MIFKRISYKIALQFTSFVFLLFLVNGAVFLAADFHNARNQTQTRLARESYLVLDQLSAGFDNLTLTLPPSIRERVRVIDVSGKPLYVGAIFTDLPFENNQGLSEMHIQNDDYAVLTSSIVQHGNLQGYIQIASLDRAQFGDLPLRVLMYLLVSGGITVLTFLVGLFFARRSLKPAEQMVERLEQFTQDASHELRTPLAALSSSLDLALRNRKYRSGIISAKEDVKEVALLVDRLLELARLDSFIIQKNSVNLTDLVKTVVEKYQPLAEEKGIALTSVISEDIQVQCDDLLLRQVIGNLLSNGIKFNKSKDGKINVRLTRQALEIEDTGIGIAKNSLEHIFDRFYQADNSRANEGYGLGLALVKRIIDLHGWSITAKSTLGVGTVFTIQLPRKS